MKFPLAQDVSRHVRDKVCKFYSVQTPTCTVTSQTTSSLEVSDSIQQQESEKVSESLSRHIVGPTLDLIETNFTDILSPSTFPLTSTGNETEENEFGMIIGELDHEGEEEALVEVSFTCKLCEFR